MYLISLFCFVKNFVTKKIKTEAFCNSQPQSSNQILKTQKQISDNLDLNGITVDFVKPAIFP